MADRQITAFGPTGLFYESPRWRAGAWWAVDLMGRKVLSFAAEGAAKVEHQLADDRPTGLGWLPDGTLLVVSMEKRQLLARAPGAGGFEVYADLGPLFGDMAGFLNDMTVTAGGHVYVGAGADLKKYAPDAGLGMLIHVDPKGHAEIAARGLHLPNGIVVAGDGSTVIVAETQKPQFSCYPVGPDGSLGTGSIWATLHPKIDKRPAGAPRLGDATPSLDGCWMDAEGCIWVADSRSACLRVAPGGDVTDAIFLPDDMRSWACCLGGVDGRSLLICGANPSGGKAAQLYIARLD